MSAALSDMVAITPSRSWLVKAVSYAWSRARIGSNSGLWASASGFCALAMDGTAAAAIVAIPIRASFRFIRAIILYTEYETQLAAKRTNEFFGFINDDHSV